MFLNRLKIVSSLSLVLAAASASSASLKASTRPATQTPQKAVASGGNDSAILPEFSDIHHYFDSTTDSPRSVPETLTLSYYMRGNPNAPTLVFPTPGWGPNAGLFLTTFFDSNHEIEKKYRIVFLETRGAGASQKPSDLDKINITVPDYSDPFAPGKKTVTGYNAGYDLIYFAQDLENLRQHLNVDKITVVGFSDGSCQAMKYAALYPEHTEKVIIVDGATHHGENAPTISEAKARWTQAQALAIGSNGMRFSTTETAKEPDMNGKAQSQALLYLVSQQNFTATSDQQFDQQFQWELPIFFYSYDNYEKYKGLFADSHFSYLAQDYDVRIPDLVSDGSMKSIKAPTLILEGDSDPICPFSNANEMLQNISGSRLNYIKKAGHFSWIENSGDFWNFFLAD